MTRVSIAAPFQPGQDLHSGLDFPAAGEVASGFLTLAGWFTLPGSRQAIRVIVTLREFGNKIICEGFATERADVRRGRRLEPGVTAYGYGFRIHRLDLPPGFTLDVFAFGDEADPRQSTRIATIVGTNTPENVSEIEGLSPLYVVGLGRSGTTALMRMLANHPAIVCGDKYPLELCVSTFHAKLARIGASFADHASYTMPQVFSGEPVVGPNPFASLAHVDRPVLERALDEATKLYAATAVQANNAWYGEIARQDPSKKPTLFVEKSVPDQGLVTALNVYSNGVVVILVRDPRDIFVSRIRFNKKRGTKDFGEQVATDWTDWAKMHVLECNALLRMNEAFRARVACVVRYEDLVSDSGFALAGICRALGLESSSEIISRMTEVAADRTGKFADHSTSTDPGAQDTEQEAKEQLEFLSRNLVEFCDTYGYST